MILEYSWLLVGRARPFHQSVRCFWPNQAVQKGSIGWWYKKLLSCSGESEGMYIRWQRPPVRMFKATASLEVRLLHYLQVLLHCLWLHVQLQASTFYCKCMTQKLKMQAVTNFSRDQRHFVLTRRQPPAMTQKVMLESHSFVTSLSHPKWGENSHTEQMNIQLFHPLQYCFSPRTLQQFSKQKAIPIIQREWLRNRWCQLC